LPSGIVLSAGRFLKEWGFEILVCAGVAYVLYVFGPEIFSVLLR